MNLLFDYEVFDRNNEKVGKVENVWERGPEEIGYIGITTGWLGLGKTHVIPAAGATIDHENKRISVPYDEATIKASSSYDYTADLTDAEERQLAQQFNVTEGCGCGTQTTGRSAASERADRVEVPLAEERVQVGKREVSLGEVRLRKVVRTEHVNVPVELRREEVVVERVRDATAAPDQDAFAEKVVTIPVKTEEAVVQKTVESAGAVRATKTATTTKQNVSETIRREEVEVDRELAGSRKR